MRDSDLFTFFIHHGGYFGKHEELDVYMRGFYAGVYDLKQSSFNLLMLHRLVKGLGYASWTKLWYRLPRTNTFKWIKGDEELGHMMNILSDKISVVSMYVEGGVDDKSGRLQTNMDYTPIFGTLTLNEETESEPVVDLDGIDGAYVDQFVTELELDEQMGKSDEQWPEVDEHWGLDEQEDNQENDNAEDENVEDDNAEDEMDDENQEDEIDDEIGEGEGDDEYIEARRNLKESADEEVNRLLREFVPPEINEEEEPVEEYADSDVEFHSEESDSEDGVIFRMNRVVYDPKCDHKSLELVIGMRFQDDWECRRALTAYSIENEKFVQFRRVSTKQCEAKCFPPCPWKIYSSYRRKNHTFCIKTYRGDHNCARHMSNKLLTSKWIAMKYLNVFRVRPLFSVEDLRHDIMDRYGYEIPKDRLYKPRSLANAMVRGTIDHHYGLIRRYVAELRRVDREGRFELLLSDDHVFKTLYLGFSSLVKGFKQSCRPIISLDGYHLKTYLGGILLCAVAKDGNDQMFPIAWAVVEVENKDCWGWFMKCLIEDIGLGDGNGYTFISDQQKGLENAVKSLTPFAEHRNCARHVWMNWKKNHPGQTLKNLFMKVVRSTYPEQYKASLEELKQESVAAYQDFINRDTHKFCKAFFSTTCKSDAITNNISKTFNDYILNARGKHVIHMCVEIRSNLMMRQVKLKEAMSRVNDRICPNIRKKLEKARLESAQCLARVALYERFEVQHGANKYSVSLPNKTCSCRQWELSGIPCVHALATYSYKGEDPALYVDEYYTVDKYMLAYEHGLEPLNGDKMWPQVEGFTVKPPRVKRMSGRPEKKRIRSAGEANPRNPSKLSLKGMPMNCSNCGGPNHNSKTCKLPRVVQPAQQKRKRGRPAKEKPPTTEGESSSNVAIRGRATRGRATRGRGATLPGRGIYIARGRGGAGSSGGRRGDFGSAAHLAAERNFAARGAGVFVGQTGNVYYHAPNSSVLQHVHRSSVSTAEQMGPLTQESRNA